MTSQLSKPAWPTPVVRERFAADLIRAWLFHEGSGDETNSPSNATFASSATWATDAQLRGVTASANAAVQGPGVYLPTAGYVDAGTIDVGDTPVSVGVYMKPKYAVSTNQSLMAAQDGGSLAAETIRIDMANGNMGFNDDYGISTSVTGVQTAGSVHAVMFTSRTREVKLYVDGLLVYTGTRTSTPPEALGDLKFGRVAGITFATSAVVFAGAVWNRELGEDDAMAWTRDPYILWRRGAGADWSGAVVAATPVTNRQRSVTP